MATYFGNQTYDGLDFYASARCVQWYASGYTCPGSGNQTVKELSAYAQIQSGACNIRLGIYDSSNNLVGYGTSEVAASTTAGWQGHLTESAVQAAAGGSCTLTGGSTYKLVLTDDSSSFNIYYGYDWSSAPDTSFKDTEYTGGFPATLPSPDGTFSGYCAAIRCGVDAEVGGTAYPYYYQANQ